ncbi:uncharacterized protein LOC62_05G007598 [Vanrija pseudolonga]|uniref:Uncharacterized protein n=1 Tax=Vanrija pseudolonga TaxID=143232 RepID=A0AAF1BN61_9TREE|nr:hypothetical protein LOC62_05G007598 [Vanrija pseudolonga]
MSFTTTTSTRTSARSSTDSFTDSLASYNTSRTTVTRVAPHPDCASCCPPSRLAKLLKRNNKAVECPVCIGFEASLPSPIRPSGAAGLSARELCFLLDQSDRKSDCDVPTPLAVPFVPTPHALPYPSLPEPKVDGEPTRMARIALTVRDPAVKPTDSGYITSFIATRNSLDLDEELATEVRRVAGSRA